MSDRKNIKTFLKAAVMPVYICAGLMIMEFAVKVNLDGMVWGTSIIYTILFSAATGLVASFLISLVPLRTGRLLTILFLGTAAMIFSSQLVYYEVFKTFYTIYSALEGGGQIIQFYREILMTIATNLHWIG